MVVNILKNTLSSIPIWVFYGFILVLTSGCGLQSRLLYHPGKITVDIIQQYAKDKGLEMWPNQGEEYRGIVSKRGPANFNGTIVIFHGNAGDAISRKYYIDALEVRGYRVVLAEYPGYGGRSGELSEASFVKDAQQIALNAKKYYGDPLYVWGESMGCGVASALANDPKLRPQGVVMLMPWDSLLNIGKSKFPWLPVNLLIQDTYDNVANLTGYKGPVAVIMCKKDKVIPNRLTETLYKSLSQPKQLWVFRNAGHNSWPTDPELAWWDEVMNFLYLKE
jgi:uncharacterized protein